MQIKKINRVNTTPFETPELTDAGFDYLDLI